jgi:hypothetical protein
MKNKITGLIIVTAASIGIDHVFSSLYTACFMSGMVLVTGYFVIKNLIKK